MEISFYTIYTIAFFYYFIIFIFIFIIFFFFSYEIIKQKRASKLPPSSTQQVFAIEGLHCGGCVRKLEKTLLDIPEIEQATVSLENNEAIVESQLPSNELKEIIEGAGFKAS